MHALMMSARNFISAREKNINKFIDCLPHINQKKCGYRSVPEIPMFTTNSASLVNRNIDLPFQVQPYSDESLDRVGTPFSDFFSDSETGTPDFRSEESDSSSGSALRRNTEEATKTLGEEWEKIERTLYDEEGEKTTKPHMIEECKQWRLLHPQFRVIGKAVPLPKNKLLPNRFEQNELIVVHYTDYEQFSESEERLSQSSTDVTPQNSPRVSAIESLYEPRLSCEKISFYPKQDEDFNIEETFSSLLQITPIQIRSPHKKRNSHSILRSEVASSRWMRVSRPDSSLNGDRSSAKSFVSLDIAKYGNVSGDGKTQDGRVLTARHRDMTRLEPIYTPEPPHNDIIRSNGFAYNNRKVSLPPLSMDEERRKFAGIGSAKRIGKPKKKQSEYVGSRKK